MTNVKSSRKNMPFIKVIVNSILTKFINILFRVNYSEYFSGFRGFNTDKLKNINLKNLSETYPIEQEIHYIFIKKKYKILEFQYQLFTKIKYLAFLLKYVITAIFTAIYYSLFK